MVIIFPLNVIRLYFLDGFKTVSLLLISSLIIDNKVIPETAFLVFILLALQRFLNAWLDVFHQFWRRLFLQLFTLSSFSLLFVVDSSHTMSYYLILFHRFLLLRSKGLQSFFLKSVNILGFSGLSHNHSAMP